MNSQGQWNNLAAHGVVCTQQVENHWNRAFCRWCLNMYSKSCCVVFFCNIINNISLKSECNVVSSLSTMILRFLIFNSVSIFCIFGVDWYHILCHYYHLYRGWINLFSRTCTIQTQEPHLRCTSHPWGHRALVPITHHHISPWVLCHQHIQVYSHSLLDVLILIKCQVL